MVTKILESNLQECKEKILVFFKRRRDHVNELSEETLYFKSDITLLLDKSDFTNRWDNESVNVTIKGTIKMKPTDDEKTEITVGIPDPHDIKAIFRVLCISGIITFLIIVLFAVIFAVNISSGPMILFFGVSFSAIGGLIVCCIELCIYILYWSSVTRHTAGKTKFLQDLFDFIINRKFWKGFENEKNWARKKKDFQEKLHDI